VITRIEDKIQAVKEQTNTYVQEIKKLVEELAVQNKISLISYFTSSFNISYLCIKLPKDSPFYFSGRYVHENFTPTLKTQGQSNWERFNDKSSKEEYWLRPVGKSTIEPNETISFTNFQIKWSHNLSYSGTIMGFTYCDQLTDGVVVLNPINLNGVSPTQEVNNGGS